MRWYFWIMIIAVIVLIIGVIIQNYVNDYIGTLIISGGAFAGGGASLSSLGSGRRKEDVNRTNRRINNNTNVIENINTDIDITLSRRERIMQALRNKKNKE